MAIHKKSVRQVIAATVLYNFRQISNVIILRLDNTPEEFILFYNPRSKTWEELTDLHLRNPELFEQILLQLPDIVAKTEVINYSTSNYN